MYIKKLQHLFADIHAEELYKQCTSVEEFAIHTFYGILGAEDLGEYAILAELKTRFDDNLNSLESLLIKKDFSKEEVERILTNIQ